MTTKIRPRTLAVLAAFVGLLGVVAVTIPSSGAAEPTVVRLNLGATATTSSTAPPGRT